MVLNEFNACINQGAQPVYVVKGPDGNLWFTELGADAIGRITCRGRGHSIHRRITPGSQPGFMALGPDGNLWFTEYGGNRIGRITPAGAITEFSGVSANANTVGITAGPDGNMWFAESSGNRIGRIIALPANGVVGTITEFSAGITAGSGPFGITAGPDGNLWFVEETLTRSAASLHPDPSRIQRGREPGQRAARHHRRPDGNMWFTEYDGNRIGKIVALPANGTVGTVTEFSTGNLSGAEPRGIAVGPDGNLWFTADRGNHIGRITLAGVVAIFPQAPTTGSGSFGITAGPDGNMWFTEFQGARIGRFLMPSGNYVVTNNTDNGAAGSGSLRDAINRATADPGPNTITFDPSVTGDDCADRRPDRDRRPGHDYRSRFGCAHDRRQRRESYFLGIRKLARLSGIERADRLPRHDLGAHSHQRAATRGR